MKFKSDVSGCESSSSHFFFAAARRRTENGMQKKDTTTHHHRHIIKREEKRRRKVSSQFAPHHLSLFPFLPYLIISIIMLFDFIHSAQASEHQLQPRRDDSLIQSTQFSASSSSSPAAPNIEQLLPPVSDDSEEEQGHPVAKARTKQSSSTQRSGRWTPDEKILFLYGLKRFGKGRWKKMSVFLPHRYD